MKTAKFAGRAADFSADMLMFAPFVLYSLDGPWRWPAWVTLTIACAGSAGIAVVWLAQSRRGRATAARYVGVSGTGEAPRSVRAWQRAIETEARGRYGPEVARLAVRGTWRVLLGRALFRIFGVVAFSSLAVAAAGGSATAYLAGGVCLGVAGIVLMLMGMADGRAAGDRARTLGAGQGPMPGIGTARAPYLRWCEQHERKPYPFGGQA